MISIELVNFNPNINFKQYICEARLIGILCCYSALFDNICSKSNYNIKITNHSKKYKLIPSKFCTFDLIDSIEDISEFCESLQSSNKYNKYETKMFTKYNKSGYDYYIPDEMIEEFTKGFIWFGNFTSTKRIDVNIISDFISDSTLIKSKDDKNNKDNKDFNNIMKKYNNHLNVPAYLWNISKITKISENNLALILISLYLNHSEDHNELDNNKYLRFMLYQDEPDYLSNSYPYVYGYIRYIKQCVYDDHKNILLSCPHDMLVCEINYKTRGYFYMFSADQWIKKHVTDVIELV